MELVGLNSQVILRKASGRGTILFQGQPIMLYALDDRETMKSVAAQLVKNELATVPEVSRGLGIPSSTLRDAVSAFSTAGIRSLIPVERGPKGPWKFTPERRQRALETAWAQPEATWAEVTASANEGEAEQVSQRHVQRCLQDVRPCLQRTACGQAGESQTPPLTVTEVAEGEMAVSSEMNEVSAASQPILPSLTAADRRYLARLRDGVESAFGGGFLALPFLHDLDFAGLVARTFSCLPDLGYTVLQMALAFFFLALFNVPSLEATRTLPYTEFGLLLGRRRGPGLDKLRRFLKSVQAVERSEAFVLAVAQQLITMGVVDWEILYLDGHFIPYFGRHVVRKGYFTVRRLAMKGHQAYYANNPQGRPFFFLLTPASDQLTAVIPRMISQVKAIVGDRWVDGVLTLIFDRGGFCAALFKLLDELKVHWITWLELNQELRQIVDQLPEEGFRRHLIRLKTTKVQLKLTEMGVYLEGYGWTRAVVILDLKTGARLVVISSDKSRSPQEIVRLMLLRWGQENFFKIMRAEKKLDYSPGYAFDAVREEPLVDNPQIKALRAKKKALKVEQARCQGELGGQLLRRKQDTISLETYKGQQEKLVRRIASLGREIDRLKAELKALPKKVPISQVLEAPLEQCNFERKRFFDEMKLVAYHAEEQLLEILSKSYTGKDRRVVLHQILHRGTWAQLVGETLYVWLKPFDRPSVQQAAEALCAALNDKEPRTLDKFRFRVVYAVQPRD